jgi:hypothetical protein
VADDAGDVLDDTRLDALRRFVEDQQSGARRECAGDGELLLLATGEIAAAAAQELAEDGKEVEDLRRHLAAARSGGKGRFQALLHGEADAVVDAHRPGAGGVNELAGGGVLAIGQGTKQGQGARVAAGADCRRLGQGAGSLRDPSALRPWLPRRRLI